MTRMRRPPTFMPGMPSSQPVMTWPWPSGNWNGWAPRDQDESNSSPVDHDIPTYCIEASWPFLTAGPLPTTRSFLISDVGGSLSGLVISGLLLRSLALGTAGAWPVVASGSAGVVSAAGAVAELVPVEAEPESLSSPQPAANRARA